MGQDLNNSSRLKTEKCNMKP